MSYQPTQKPSWTHPNNCAKDHHLIKCIVYNFIKDIQTNIDKKTQVKCETSKFIDKHLDGVD